MQLYKIGNKVTETDYNQQSIEHILQNQRNKELFKFSTHTWYEFQKV